MANAFQRSGFQDNAFQEPTGGAASGGAQWQVRVANRNTGPLALRRQLAMRRAWIPPYAADQGITDEAFNAAAWARPVAPANRNTGPMALRRAGLYRRQWATPWGGLGADQNYARVTQEAIEALVQSDSASNLARVTQVAIEVLRHTNPEGGTQIIIVGM